jgi:hypothetical protein
VRTEELLRDGLAEVGERISVPAGLGLRAHEHWRRARRVRRTRRAVLSGAAMVTAGALALTLTGGSAGAGRGFGAAEQPTAFTVRQVDAALSAASSAGLVQYATMVLPPGSGAPIDPPYIGAQDNPHNTRPVFRQFYDQGRYAATFYGRPGDEIFATRVVTGSRQVASTVVSYFNHTWWHSTGPADPPVSSQWCYGGPGGWISNWIPVVRSLLACRDVKINNTPGRLDGQAAIELSQWEPHLGSWYLWVNPVTYLPLRLTNVWFGSDHGTSVTTFQWLRPTSANLAPFRLSVPRGYREVSAPVG